MGYSLALNCDSPGCFARWSKPNDVSTVGLARRKAHEQDAWAFDGVRDYCRQHAALAQEGSK
jgi:hypothetical protein